MGTYNLQEPNKLRGAIYNNHREDDEQGRASLQHGIAVGMQFQTS